MPGSRQRGPHDAEGAETGDLACECCCVHPEALARARAGLPGEEDVAGLAETFKLLGDPTRVRLLLALAAAGELCVCDLAELLGTTSSAVSHQLRLLRAARLVKSRREGKLVYTALDDDHVRRLFAEALEHVRERQGSNHTEVGI